jgi:hypothetical protein
MDHRFVFERNPPVMEPLPARRIPMFQFRVQCAGGIEHDVQAACEEDARKHIRKRFTARIKAVQLVGEVRRYG